jgi:hypothetical protein
MGKTGYRYHTQNKLNLSLSGKTFHHTKGIFNNLKSIPMYRGKQTKCIASKYKVLITSK